MKQHTYGLSYLTLSSIMVDSDQLRVRPAFDPLTTDKELVTDIAYLGLMQPILVDEYDNLIDGYRRLMACKHLGYVSIPAVIINGFIADRWYASARMVRPATVYTIVCQRADEAETICNSSDVEPKWIALELASGLNRKALTFGMRVLRLTEELENHDTAEKREFGRRIRSTFKNCGLATAMRMSEAFDPKDIDFDPLLDRGTWEQDND